MATTIPVLTASFTAIAQFSKFSTLDSASTQVWLDLYAAMIPQEEFGDRTELCTMLLTAHYLELVWEETGIDASNTTAVASGGAIANRRSPSPNMVTNDYLSRTAYGQQFLMIRDFIKAGSFFGDAANIAVPPFLAF